MAGAKKKAGPKEATAEKLGGFRIDQALLWDVEDVAKVRTRREGKRVTMRAVIEESIREHLAAELAAVRKRS